jgi:hypothetical protein
VWEVPDFFDRICCNVGDEVVGVTEIEHGFLRGNRPHPLATSAPFSPTDPRRARAITPLDPRIHGAISCGARSRPPVRAYDAERLDMQLDAAAHAFVTRRSQARRAVSPITELFRWFEGDFAEHPGGFAGFLLRHLADGPARRALHAHGLAGVTWRPYDWRLAPPPVPSRP